MRSIYYSCYQPKCYSLRRSSGIIIFQVFQPSSDISHIQILGWYEVNLARMRLSHCLGFSRCAYFIIYLRKSSSMQRNHIINFEERVHISSINKQFIFSNDVSSLFPHRLVPTPLGHPCTDLCGGPYLITEPYCLE